ncbi:hypothetical protein GCM10012275_30390 [Longimycelium tulufanense]|uniref:Uncharacterized protein n=1 Tax=Longimycelium tulufanense TaxID=907463 RepID=A0A8J3CGE7_9PSEU|nr:hypothetical protein GCM10012275_30390 [Longimycelium tulufanense]
MTQSQSLFLRRLLWQLRRPVSRRERRAMVMAYTFLAIGTFLLATRLVPLTISVPIFVIAAVTVITCSAYWYRKALRKENLS